MCAMKLSNIDTEFEYYKVFLLFNSVDRAIWTTILTDSRDGYGALREHFLKDIEHPDEIESAADPLSDNQNVCSYSLTTLCRL